MPSAYEKQLTLLPPRILGRQMNPFLLGHAHLLDIAESPFMRGGKITSDDLILAAYILRYPDWSRARAAALAALRGRIPRWVRRWGRRAVRDGIDFDSEAAALAGYIEACTKPPRTAKRKDAKPLATPTAATIAVLHRHYFHTAPGDAWNLPFLDAMLDVLTYYHARGWLEIVSEKQADFIDSIVARKNADAGSQP